MSGRGYGRQRVVVATPDQRIEIGLRPGETLDDVVPDIESSLRFTEQTRADGTQAWRSRFRWLGPVKVMAYKEVGPPPWRWPKVGIQSMSHGKMVRFIVGWRSTAYALCVLWAGRHEAHSEHSL